MLSSEFLKNGGQLLIMPLEQLLMRGAPLLRILQRFTYGRRTKPC